MDWLPSLVLFLGFLAFVLGLAAMRPRLARGRGSSAVFICFIIVLFALVLIPCFALAYVSWGLRGWQ